MIINNGRENIPASNNEHPQGEIDITQIHVTYFQILKTLLNRKVSNDLLTEEIILDCFSKIYKTQKTFPSYLDGLRYLRKAVNNELNDVIKEQNKKRNGKKKLPFISDGNLQKEIDTAEALRITYTMIEDMPSQRKEVLRLHVKGYSTSEIAEALGMTEQNVLNTKSTGLNKIKAALVRKGLSSF